MDIGGAETHVLELCRALKAKGLDVYIASNGGTYEKELEDCGIKHFCVPLHKKGPGSLIKSYNMLKRIIRDNNIRLVHAHARIPAFLCGLLKRKLKFTFVTTAHLDFKVTWYFRMLSNWGDAALAVSEDLKKYLVNEYKMKEEDVALTINGIDTEKFSPEVDGTEIRQEFGLAPKQRLIVYLSRMDADRSQPAHVLVECAEGIYKHDNNAVILIVGGGDDFEAVKAEADAANAKIGVEVIKIAGARTDANKIVAAADIYVAGARAALEGMASGKPVILSYGQGYLGVFEEPILEAAIETNFCCRGYEQTSKERLTADITKLLDNGKEQLTKLGEFGRNVVVERYSMERMADDAIGLYNKALKMSDDEKRWDVVISGYYGFNNHGDDAILKTIIDDLRGYNPNIRIMVLTLRTKEIAKQHNVDVTNRYNLLKITKRLKQTKLLIYGGGSLIQDGTSSRSLWYYLHIIKAALKSGVRVMLYANGIGPLNVEANKVRAANVLNKIDVITLRDTASLETLNDIGVKAPVIDVTADVVFGVKNTAPEEGHKVLETLGLAGKQFFCISVRNWRTLPADFIEQIAAYADEMAEEHGLAVLFISMQSQNDTAITRRIMAEMKQPSYFAGENLSVNTYLGICEKAVFMVAMRLHAAIYAMKCRKPVVGIIYDPKVKGVLNDFKQKRYVEVEVVTASKLLKFSNEILNGSIENEYGEGFQNNAEVAAKNIELAAGLLKNQINGERI